MKKESTMDRVMLNPMQQMAYHPSYPMDQGYYMNYPFGYSDIYYYKWNQINYATSSANEQGHRMLEAIAEMKRKHNK